MWLRKRDQKIQDATFLFLCVMALYSLGTKMRVLLEGLAPLILFGLPLAVLEAELHLGFFGWNWARVWTQPILLSLKQKDLLLAWAYRPEFSLGDGPAKLGPALPCVMGLNDGTLQFSKSTLLHFGNAAPSLFSENILSSKNLHPPPSPPTSLPPLLLSKPLSSPSPLPFFSSPSLHSLQPTQCHCTFQL